MKHQDKIQEEMWMATRWRVHTEHHADLFLGFLIPSINSQRTSSSVSNSLFEDALISEWEEMSTGWAIDEIMMLGYVSGYHMWERHISAFVKLKLSNLDKPPLKNDNTPFTLRMRKVIEGLDIKVVSAEIWKELEKTRKIVNAYKHGVGTSFDKARAEYPEFFSPSYIDGDQDFITIDKVKFNSLMATLRNFWDCFAS